MKEAALRKWHRRMGATLAVFIILQVGSGLLLSMREVLTPKPLSAHSRTSAPVTTDSSREVTQPPSQAIMQPVEKDGGILWAIHHKEGIMYGYYRSAVGFGILGMVVSGLRIFAAIRKRSRD
jgi:hypothetical protein